LTGHLVLATLHTNNAAASVTRLLDMGVEDYLLASTLRGIVAQRLVRRVCEACRTFASPDQQLIARLNAAERTGARLDRVPVSHGCPACRGTGYSGRTTIAEMLPIRAEVRELILLAHAGEAALEEAGRKVGMQSLQQSGLAKVRAGETTLEEVLRVTRSI
jgi:general secretion pathway protein E